MVGGVLEEGFASRAGARMLLDERRLGVGADRLHLGGDTELAAALLEALHERLFGNTGPLD